MDKIERIEGFALTPEKFNRVLSRLSQDLGFTLTEDGLYTPQGIAYKVLQYENCPDLRIDKGDTHLSSVVVRMNPLICQFVLASIIASDPETNERHARVLLYHKDKIGRALFEEIKKQRDYRKA